MRGKQQAQQGGSEQRGSQRHAVGRVAVARLHGDHPLGAVGAEDRGAAVAAQPHVRHGRGNGVHALRRLLLKEGAGAVGS